MRITITRDGSVYLRNSRVAPQELLSNIQDSLCSGFERKIYLSVDARARYFDVTPVLDEISAAHIQDVAFFTTE
jgi:biopolymer transport protein ExbD